jgi:TatD DNase family protein
MSILIDSHCHLDLVENTTPSHLIHAAQQQGVQYFLSVAVDLEHFPQLLTIAQQHPNVCVSVGVHPNTPCKTEVTVAQLVALAQHPAVVAIGETGLDYYRSHGDLRWQQQRFRTHIRAAKEAAKPLIIHCRDAAADTLNILREEQVADIGGVMHCFVEDWEVAQQAMALGLLISFSGIVTFKTAKTLHEVARRCPLAQMLVETDSPYLAPVPYRGKVNQPAYVKHVAQFIAELRGQSFDSIAIATTQNFLKLFSTPFRVELPVSHV